MPNVTIRLAAVVVIIIALSVAASSQEAPDPAAFSAPTPAIPQTSSAATQNAEGRDELSVPPVDTAETRAEPQSEPAQPESGAAMIQQWMHMSAQLNDRLLTTVFWALGTVGAVFVGLIGYGWFANWRIYERDKMALRTELETELKVMFSSLRDELQEIYKSRLEALENELESRVDEIKKQFSEGLNGIRNEFTFEGARIRIDILKFESSSWEQQGVIANAIYTEAQIINTALKIGYDFVVDSAIERIESLLNKGVRSGPWETKLVEELSELPQKYGPIVRRITQKLESNQK